MAKKERHWPFALIYVPFKHPFRRFGILDSEQMVRSLGMVHVFSWQEGGQITSPLPCIPQYALSFRKLFSKNLIRVIGSMQSDHMNLLRLLNHFTDRVDWHSLDALSSPPLLLILGFIKHSFIFWEGVTWLESSLYLFRILINCKTILFSQHFERFSVRVQRKEIYVTIEWWLNGRIWMIACTSGILYAGVHIFISQNAWKCITFSCHQIT